MIAYHFPPLAGSSGIQRALRFVQHLPSFGWEPLVLTTHPRAYEITDPELTAEVPGHVIVKRAFALDTARHLALRGRYLGWMARPDRWISWRFAAVRDGLSLVERYRPEVIWSTYPIATAHVIGSALQRRTGLPWIADFRDPMAQDGYPSDPLVWRSYKRIEEDTIRRAKLCTLTAPSAVTEYRHRYRDASKRILLLENGYEEQSFPSSGSEDRAEPLVPGAVTLLHSGIVYPSERDPTALFVAMRRLLDSGKLAPGTLKIRFRGAVHSDLLKALSVTYAVEDYIELVPPLPYRAALAEMMRADALLVIQASNCNAQIPAKLYEYMRAGRPVLALTDPEGDTSTVLRGFGLTAITSLHSAEGIQGLLPYFVAAVRSGRATLPDPAAVASASRRERAKSLVEMIERVLTPTESEE
jgi:glycosyltransferase involved in cell wall biosynthesis